MSNLQSLVEAMLQNPAHATTDPHLIVDRAAIIRDALVARIRRDEADKAHRAKQIEKAIEMITEYIKKKNLPSDILTKILSLNPHYNTSSYGDPMDWIIDGMGLKNNGRDPFEWADGICGEIYRGIRSLPWAVGCPHCNQGPGHDCVQPNGYNTKFHRARLNKLKEDNERYFHVFENRQSEEWEKSIEKAI
jgi:hypothetical protein